MSDLTATVPQMRGVYWACPECQAQVVTTIPHPMGWLASAMHLDVGDTELDFRWLPTHQLTEAESMVEEHEDGHLLWREFEETRCDG